MTDKQKRDSAVRLFCEAMKDRLDAKAAKGYTGWDTAVGPNADNIGLVHLILYDATSMADKAYGAEWERLAVDVGARAMMLWSRAQSCKEKQTCE